MIATNKTASQTTVQRSPWLLGVISTVIIVVITLLLLETGLRIIGYGDPNERRDPLYGFHGTPPIFSLSGEQGHDQRYVPRPNIGDITATFPVKKPPGGYRVFAFGGSTTYGQPYGNEGGFPYFLEHELREFYPDRPIEVINCGVKGYGSSRVLPIVEEAVNYEPDLFVIYMGQNEYRDAQFHYWELHQSPLTSALLSTLFKSRALFFLHERYLDLESLVFGHRITSHGASLIESILSAQDPQKGFTSYDYYAVPEVVSIPPGASKGSEQTIKRKLKSFVKQILRHGEMTMSGKEVEQNFQKNVSQMIEIATQHGVDIVLLEISSNPKDRNLLHRDTIALPNEYLSSFPKDELLTRYTSGLAHLKKDEYREAITDFEEAKILLEKRNDRTLQLHLGEAYEGYGDYNRARAEYEHRLSGRKKRLNSIIETTGNLHGVPALDVSALFREHAVNGIIGYDNYFVDSIHMSINGYRLIAHALAGELIRNGTLPATDVNPDIVAKLMKAKQPRETASVVTTLGWAAFNQGQTTRALELGEQARIKDPRDLGAHVLLGYVYVKLGRTEDARHNWEQLRSLYAEASH